VLFVGPGVEVYEGMIVGENSRSDEMNVNPTKEKKLTNMRASGSDNTERIAPPTIFSLEQALEFIADDEAVEVTPQSVRLRKAVLDVAARAAFKEEVVVSRRGRPRRDDRAAECTGLENRRGLAHRGFKSHSLRQVPLTPSDRPRGGAAHRNTDERARNDARSSIPEEGCPAPGHRLLVRLEERTNLRPATLQFRAEATGLAQGLSPLRL
jgi:hypothetical protein